MSIIVVKEFWADPKKRQIIIWGLLLIGGYFLVPVFFSPSDRPKLIDTKNSGTELFSVDEVDQMEERKSKELFNQLAADAQNRELAAKTQEDRLVGREKKWKWS